MDKSRWHDGPGVFRSLPSLPHMSTKDDKERELFAQIRKREDAEREDGAPETWKFILPGSSNEHSFLVVCCFVQVFA